MLRCVTRSLLGIVDRNTWREDLNKAEVTDRSNAESSSPSLIRRYGIKGDLNELPIEKYDAKHINTFLFTCMHNFY